MAGVVAAIFIVFAVIVPSETGRVAGLFIAIAAVEVVALPATVRLAATTPSMPMLFCPQIFPLLVDKLTVLAVNVEPFELVKIFPPKVEMAMLPGIVEP